MGPGNTWHALNRKHVAGFESEARGKPGDRRHEVSLGIGGTWQDSWPLYAKVREDVTIRNLKANKNTEARGCQLSRANILSLNSDRNSTVGTKCQKGGGGEGVGRLT